MKCNKLIKILQEFNPNADVTTPISEDICISYITDDGEFDKSSTPFIFIEPADTCQTCSWYNDSYCDFYGEECADVEECYQYEVKI